MNWTEFENEISKLAALVKKKPDIIVGIVRGGLVPARLLSSRLGVKDMCALTVKKVGDERKVVTKISGHLTGKTVLLIEDMLETGQSLIVAKEYLESKGARVETACLYTTPISEISPDYYLKELRDTVRFPWE